MKIHHVAIAIVIVSLLVSTTILFINDFGSYYSTTADFSTINQTVNRSAAIINTSRDLANDISGFIPDAEEGGVLLIPYNFLQVAWGAAKVFFNSFWVLEGVISDIMASLNELNISPSTTSVISGVIVTILIISLIAIVVFAFFKWKFED